MIRFCFPRMKTNAASCHPAGLRVGRQVVKNHNMTGSGRPSSLPTEIYMVRLEEMIQNDRWLTLRENSSELGLSYGSMQFIVSHVMRYSRTVT
ncbi:hypothetical protein TNCV_73011 [Trichonephila clavipes]|uniref:Uncharacterized protein n=1 Tax=Trichonephila clavipes TaxID=2585209 RepID=A0A8X6UVR4_TRICX|nr:hypothetical protein TNCV_73011 [Trichonephila clavipes]